MEKKVLLVADDDKMNRMIISKFLKNDYDVLEAMDGRQALDLIASTHVDAVLLDIIMPELDGLEVLKEIQARAQHGDEEYGNIGVLVATSTKEKTERTALSLGADDIVSKPYDPVVIKKRLQNILAVKAANHDLALQQNESSDAYLQEKLKQARQRVENTAEQIKRCAKLIAANKENYALVSEMVSEITQQAENLGEAVLPNQ